jgi:hypothetical protein
MDLVQLRMADTAGEKLDEHLIRFRIRESDVIDDQWRVRFNEDGGFRPCRHGFPLFEQHGATTMAVARLMSAKIPAAHETHPETGTLP